MFTNLKSRLNPRSKSESMTGNTKRDNDKDQYRDRDQRKEKNGIVTAHFMLGNTYAYTRTNWETDLRIAQSIGIDAFALNLGPEEWQFTQLQTAYKVAEEVSNSTPNSNLPPHSKIQNPIPKLFISFDMNVLPSISPSNLSFLISILTKVSKSSSQLRITKTEVQGIRMVGDGDGRGEGRIVVSTFGGGDARFGGSGWKGLKEGMKREGFDIFFIPAFFLPPTEILQMDYVDGTFAWNAGWPKTRAGLTLDEDRPFIQHNSKKPYMVAVSPWFFTHYGTEPPWGWNKNWIYPSDDSLYLRRWSQILDPSFHHEFVQIISWNDYGESHYIAPISGSQPGSESWTDGMNHVGWLEMTKWFVRRYKGLPNNQRERIKVYLTYRTQPAALMIEDPVGRPDRADMAQDIISVLITFAPDIDTRNWTFQLLNGGRTTTTRLQPDSGIDQQNFTIPFTPGDVSFVVHSGSEVILEGKGRQIIHHANTYNFNAWTGYIAVE